MEFRRQAHCVFYTGYHLVFVAKYRRNILKGGLGHYILVIFENISKRYPDIEILEMNTDEDHVRLLVSIPPRTSVSDAVRLLKSLSARAMRKRFGFLKKMYEHEDLGVWSDGYFVSAVGCNGRIIMRYIERQGHEDRGQAKLVWT